VEVRESFSSPEILESKAQCDLARYRGAAPYRLHCDLARYRDASPYRLQCDLARYRGAAPYRLHCPLGLAAPIFEVVPRHLFRRRN